MIKETTKNDLTVKQFADEIDVSHDLVIQWLHAGKIKGRRRNPFAKQSAFLIPASELERVKKLMDGNSKS